MRSMTGELARMRTVQTSAMFSFCKIGVLSKIKEGAAIRETITYSSTAIACGVGPISSRKSTDPAQQPSGDLLLRLPAGTTLSVDNLVQITNRNGETLATPEIYRVLGSPNAGPTGVTCQIQRRIGNAPGGL